MLSIALLAAFTLAANHSSQIEELGFFGNYLYWTYRILIEAAFFIGGVFIVERYLKQRMPEWTCYLLATFISLIPFMLAVTALDMIIGLPELGYDFYSDDSISLVRAFGMELIYLLDDHAVLGALLLLPRMILRSKVELAASSNLVDQPVEEPRVSYPKKSLVKRPFLDSLKPALEGRICSIKAQEDSTLVATTEESRLISHRFSDVVKQMPETQGMQVHQFHWVAHFEVEDVVVEGKNMMLKLVNEEIIPVSSSFRAAVKSQYSG